MCRKCGAVETVAEEEKRKRAEKELFGVSRIERAIISSSLAPQHEARYLHDIWEKS